MVTHYSDHTVVFTDGPVTNRLMDCAFILNENLLGWSLASISGHIGISGNKVADATGRVARTQLTLITGGLSLDCRTAFRRCI
jgi:hypothetical protein